METCKEIDVFDTEVIKVEKNKSEISEAIDKVIDQGSDNEDILLLMKSMIKDIKPVTSITVYIDEIS